MKVLVTIALILLIIVLLPFAYAVIDLIIEAIKYRFGR